MVHPYLRRRDGLEPISFPEPSPEHGPADELRAVLGKTLGVPLFQEQAMRLAIEAARFTPEEANGLRRSMATFRNLGDVGLYRAKFVGGMTARGYDADFAERCFRQIEGFGSYGFPESHAVSFAKLVYISAWIKRHHPDVFCVAMLGSQPMGFYQPAQLVRDAREHGVEVRPPDVLLSGWDSRLEYPLPFGARASSPLFFPAPANTPTSSVGCPPDATTKKERAGNPRSGKNEVLIHPVRLGLRQITGLKEDEARKLIAAREAGARTLPEIAARAGLSSRSLELLAEADALRSLGLDRRAGLWAVKGLAPEARAETRAPLLALMGAPTEAAVQLPAMALPTHVAEDYRTTRLSLKAHPCSFFRPLLTSLGAVTAAHLRQMKDGARVAVGGLVLVRQRPGTAKGVVFVTLEDETGSANAVVWQDVFTTNRRTVMSAAFLVVHGRMQRAGEVIHIVAERFADLSPRLAELRTEAGPEGRRSPGQRGLVRSRDFH